MSDLLVNHVPDALNKEIARAPKSGGQSLSAKPVALLNQGLQMEREESAKLRASACEALRSALVETGFDVQFAKELGEIEVQSKRDFGRPVDFGNLDEETDGVADG